MKEKEYKLKSQGACLAISAETNRLLTESAKRARRSKRKPFYGYLMTDDLFEHIEGNYQELLIKY
ncbi:hypothetical protein [Providencia hangzhouensis]|uniref:hypothetical protein n=1 Tax=Providencia hangzhouensis TaxID=3031799 RepID=UPI00397AB1F5